MSQNVLPPFPVFVGRDGLAIDGGRVYIGNPGADPVVSPKSIYYDPGLTLLATQPLRTSGGLIYRNGSPTSIYVDGDYSIRVTNENNELVYSAASAEIRITTDGDVFISSGTNLTVELGGSAIIADGAALTLGDGSGAGAVFVVASTTRVTGNWVPDINGRDLGNSGQRWDLFAGAIDATSIKSSYETQPAVEADLAILNRRMLPLAACRQTNTGASPAATTTNIYNAGTITHPAPGVYDIPIGVDIASLDDVTFSIVADGQGIIPGVTLSSSSVSSIRVNFYSAPAAAAVDCAFSFSMFGRVPA